MDAEVDPLKEEQYLERRLLKRLCERAALSTEERTCVELYNEKLSIRAVARQTGYSKSQVHRYLERAEDLMAEAVREIVAERRDDWEPLLDHPLNPDPPTPVFAKNTYTGAWERVRLHPESII